MKRRFLVIALCAVLLLRIWNQDGYTDFQVFYLAAKRALDGQNDLIYDLNVNGNSPYRYFPGTWTLWIPYTLLSLNWARRLWALTQLGLYGYCFTLLGREQQNRYSSFALFLAFGLSFRFFFDSILIGQSTSILLFSSLCFFHLSKIGKPILAGLALGVAVSFKLGPIILLLPWLREPKIIAKQILGITILFGCLSLWTVLTSLFFGGKGLLPLLGHWVHMLASDSSFFDAAHYGSQSLHSALLRLEQVMGLMRGSLQWVWWLAVSLYTLGAWVYLRISPQLSKNRLFAYALCGYCLFMPFTFKYSLPLLIFPLYLVAREVIFNYKSANYGIRAIYLAATFGSFLLLMSLGGLDVVGPKLFYAIQKASVPSICIMMLTIAILRLEHAE